MNSDPFLQPIPGANPCGEEVRHTQGYLAIRARIEPAQRARRLDSENKIKPTSGVAWDEVVDEAEEVADKGRDLRLLVIVARAWTNMEGFAGLAEGCAMLSNALTDYWPSIHPELRESADHVAAATGRKNALSNIENRDDGTLGDLMMQMVLQPETLDHVSGSELAQVALNDFEFVNTLPDGIGDERTAEYKEAHDRLKAHVALVLKAMQHEAPGTVEKLAEDAERAGSAVADLEAAYNRAGGFEEKGGLVLKDLKSFLANCRDALKSAGEPAKAHAADAPVANGRTQSMENVGAAAQPPLTSGSGGVPGQIATRGDVEKCLDRIVEFYERTEPSSPIPYLAKRLRRMVPMDFMQLIEEVAKGGLNDFKTAAGIDPKKKPDNGGS